MDWLLLVTGAIFLIGFCVGVYRGAIRIAVSLLTTVITLVIVVFATPFVSEVIMDKTPADEVIVDYVSGVMANVATSQMLGEGEESLTEEEVRRILDIAGVTEEQLAEYGISIASIVNGEFTTEQLADYGISSRLWAGFDDEEIVEEAIEGAEISRDMQVTAIEKADLPGIFKELLTTNNNDEIYEKLGVETFAQYVGNFLAQLIIHIVTFLALFIIITIVLRAIVFALDIVSNLPVLGFLNRLAGGAVGIVCALVIVWIIFIFITLLYVTSFGKEMYEMLQNNDILKMIYDNNPIMNLAIKFK